MPSNSDTSHAILIAIGDRRNGAEAAYEGYLAGATPILVNHGARPLGRYAVQKTLLGDANHDVVFLAEFPDADAIEAVFSSSEYRSLLPLRDRAFASLTLLIANG